MNQISSICKSLLKGEVLSIMVAFKWFGVTNLPREAGRSVERKFGVSLDRTRIQFTSRYGQLGTYMEYRLMYVPENAAGILKMEAYIKEIEGKPYSQKVKRGPKVKKKNDTVTTQPILIF